MSWQEKVDKLLNFGIDCVIVEEFSIAFAGHPPKWFAREIINTRLQARTVVVGHDFRYGKARGGTVQSLRKTLPDVKVCQISAFQKEDEVVFSSEARKREKSFNKETPREAYTLRGIVVAGKQKGEKLAFPQRI